MRWRPGARFDLFHARIGMPLDTNDGKDDHRRGFVLSISAAEPHDAPLVRKFDDVAHRAVLYPPRADSPIRTGRYLSD